MKKGANRSDMNTIKRLMAEGHNAEIISRATRVDLTIVSELMAHFEEGGAGGLRPVDLKTPEDVAAVQASKARAKVKAKRKAENSIEDLSAKEKAREKALAEPPKPITSSKPKAKRAPRAS